MKIAGSLLCMLSMSSASAFVSQSTTTTGNKQSSPSLLSATNTLDGRKIEGDIKPLNNFLLLKVAEAQDQTDGGILLTGKAKIQKTEGTVVSVGPGKTHAESGVVVDMSVEPGNGVVYGKFDGTEINFNGATHTLIRDDDILVKFDGSQPLSLDNVDVISDNVLVYVDKKEQTSEGGILIAKSTSSESRPSTGKVHKVGPGRVASNGELMAMDVAVGDMVKFRDFAGNEVEIDGEEYSVVRMADILAKY